MDCRGFRNDLEEYLQGGLDFAGRFGMERHAEQCYVCKRTLDEAGKIGDWSRSLARVQAPANFEARLLERIHAREAGGLRSLLDRIRMAWDFRSGELSWRALAAVWVPALAVAAAVVVVWRAEPAADAPAAVVQDRPAPAPVRRSDAPAPPLTAASTPAVETAAADRTAGSDLLREPLRAAATRPSTRPPLRAGRAPKLEPADSDYLEYRVPGERELILRLPATIRMRYAQPSEDHFIRNVSH